MENPAWLFVVASVIAVLGIVITFKFMMSSLIAVIDDADQFNTAFQQEQIRFLIKTAVIQAITLILVVMGFLMFENAGQVDILIPLVIIAGVLIFGVVNIFLTGRQLSPDENIPQIIKNRVMTSTFIGLGTITAIPFISIVFLLVQLIQ